MVVRAALVLLVLAGATCAPRVALATPRVSVAPVVIATGGPQAVVPSPSLPPGLCTRAGMTDAQLIQRWLELAGKHDPAAVRDCFAVSYGVPDLVADRWAGMGGPTKVSTRHVEGDIVNGCDRFTVTAEFPYGNPYAPVQDANTMFFVVGVGLDGDKPRIFGTATGEVQRSPDVSPHAGPPDCR